MELEHFVQQYGYLALFIGTFLEGETIVIIGGFLAHNGYLDFWWVALASFLGSFVGDQLYFYIGRRQGMALLKKKPQWQPKLERVFRAIKTHETLFILTFRFLYGLRTVSPFALGAAGVNPFKFFILNAISAWIWAMSFTYLGYAIGQIALQFFENAKYYEQWILLAIVVVGLIIWIAYTLKTKPSKPD